MSKKPSKKDPKISKPREKIKTKPRIKTGDNKHLKDEDNLVSISKIEELTKEINYMKTEYEYISKEVENILYDLNEIKKYLFCNIDDPIQDNNENYYSWNEPDIGDLEFCPTEKVEEKEENNIPEEIMNLSDKQLYEEMESLNRVIVSLSTRYNKNIEEIKKYEELEKNPYWSHVFDELKAPEFDKKNKEQELYKIEGSLNKLYELKEILIKVINSRK